MLNGRFAGALAALVVLVCGCGGGADQRVPPAPPDTPLAAALATVSGGGANGSLGIGWAEPARARDIGGGPDLIATALAPNARSVVEAAPSLKRRFGLAPLAARRLISVGGSYAFGLRLDGLTAPRLRRALLAAGGRGRERSDATELNVGGYASVPDPLVRAGILGLGARDAFTADSIVLAISVTARAALLGRGEALIDEPVYAAAADCLGDGIGVARLVPAKLLLSTELGFEQVAIGIARDREILCVLGYSTDLAGQYADRMRGSFAPTARDPRTGQPLSGYVRSVAVSADERDRVAIARVEVVPVHGAQPGFLLDEIARGSLPELITGR